MYLVCRLLLVPVPPHTSPLSLHDALPIFFGGGTTPSCIVEASTPGLLRATIDLWFKPATSINAALTARQGIAGLSASTDPHANGGQWDKEDRKSTRLNSSHRCISYAVFCLSPCLPTPPLFPYTTLFRSSLVAAPPRVASSKRARPGCCAPRSTCGSNRPRPSMPR